MNGPLDPAGWAKLGELFLLFGVLFAWVGWELWTLRRPAPPKRDEPGA